MLKTEHHQDVVYDPIAAYQKIHLLKFIIFLTDHQNEEDVESGNFHWVRLRNRGSASLAEESPKDIYPNMVNQPDVFDVVIMYAFLASRNVRRKRGLWQNASLISSISRLKSQSKTIPAKNSGIEQSRAQANDGRLAAGLCASAFGNDASALHSRLCNLLTQDKDATTNDSIPYLWTKAKRIGGTRGTGKAHISEENEHFTVVLVIRSDTRNLSRSPRGTIPRQ